MSDSGPSDRTFLGSIGRRKSDWVRFVVEIILIIKVVTGDIPIEALLGVL